MFPRTLTKKLVYAATKFPVITITGPRQSGKTTLAQSVFPQKQYVTLEDLDNRDFAKNDPRGFLSAYTNGVIIDEVQYVPEILSYIQTHVDKNKTMGEFILTGSQHFHLVEKLSQSLAGRSALFELLPLSLSEIPSHLRGDLNTTLLKGFYPAIYDRDINPQVHYKAYLNTYVERDVRTLSAVKDLSKFKLFLNLCAGRIGQLLNMSSLGNDCGIDQSTVKSWLSILEASYIIFLLKPHHKNFNKRLTKQPKLYFYDTGLASYLLGIHSSDVVMKHYIRGSLFENYVAIELIKRSYHEGTEPHLYFWRDHHGHEVDFIYESGNALIPIEVKSTETMGSFLANGLEYWEKLTQVSKSFLVYGGSQAQQYKNITITPWFDVEKII